MSLHLTHHHITTYLHIQHTIATFITHTLLLEAQSSNKISDPLIIQRIIPFISDSTMNSKRDRISRRVSHSVSRNGHVPLVSDSRRVLEDSWDEGSFQVLSYRGNIDLWNTQLVLTVSTVLRRHSLCPANPQQTHRTKTRKAASQYSPPEA